MPSKGLTPEERAALQASAPPPVEVNADLSKPAGGPHPEPTVDKLKRWRDAVDIESIRLRNRNETVDRAIASAKDAEGRMARAQDLLARLEADPTLADLIQEFGE